MVRPEAEHTDPVLGVFVYGTLMPGHLRWPLVRNAVEHVTAARSAGVLYDTGAGYPAACFDEPGWIDGWLLHISPGRRSRTLDLLDRVEGPSYHRVPITLEGGTDALSYEWIGARSGLVALSGRWTTTQEG